VRRFLVLAGVLGGCDASFLLGTRSDPPPGEIDVDGGSVVTTSNDANASDPDPDASAVTPMTWVDSCTFAFDYQQRSASATTLSSALMFDATTQLAAGEAGIVFLTNDTWATTSRMCLPVTGEVRDLVRLDDHHALAVTSTGSIALAKQDGTAWAACDSAASAGIDLTAATVVRKASAGGATALDIVAVGAGGKIVRGQVSVGATYSCGPFAEIASPVTKTLADVTADTASGLVIATGFSILRSTDFGQTFSSSPLPTGYNHMNVVASLGTGGFLLSGTQLIGSPDTMRILWSADGITLEQQPAFGSSLEVKTITPIDADRAWIFARASGASLPPRVSIATRSNGAWIDAIQPQPASATFMNPLGTLVSLDADHATWVCPSGQVVTLSDGQTWVDRTSGSPSSIHDIELVGSSATSVRAPTTAGSVLRSDDAGGTWTTFAAASSALNAIASPSDAVTFAVGTNGVIVRRTPTGFEIDPTNTGTTSLADVDCVDDARCYAVGLKRSFLEWSGSGWSQVSAVATGTTTLFALDVMPGTPARGIAVGAAGTYFVLTDATWTEQPALAGVDLTNVALAKDGSGLAFALGTTTDGNATPVRYRSSDFGASWALDATLPELKKPRGITQDPVDGSWYTLGYASLYKSTDNGGSWHQLPLPVSKLIQNDVAVRAGHVYAVGNVGMVMHSATGGELP